MNLLPIFFKKKILVEHVHDQEGLLKNFIFEEIKLAASLLN